jgi:hypothetical protein
MIPAAACWMTDGHLLVRVRIVGPDGLPCIVAGWECPAVKEVAGSCAVGRGGHPGRLMGAREPAEESPRVG